VKGVSRGHRKRERPAKRKSCKTCRKSKDKCREKEIGCEKGRPRGFPKPHPVAEGEGNKGTKRSSQRAYLGGGKRSEEKSTSFLTEDTARSQEKRKRGSKAQEGERPDVRGVLLEPR